MTNRGLVVTEVVEDIAGPSGAITTPTTPGGGDRQRCGRLTSQTITYRRTVVHAVAGGTENQMAEYIIMTAATILIAIALTFPLH
jgi:hypothetical protein